MPEHKLTVGYMHKGSTKLTNENLWHVNPISFDLILMLVRENASLFPLFPLPLSQLGELVHHRSSHWSGWIAVDSDAVLCPSEEDPLTHPGSPSNGIDNSGAAALSSPCANKFTIQTWTKVLKMHARNTLICFWERLDNRRTHMKLKCFLFRFYFLPWFVFFFI